MAQAVRHRYQSVRVAFDSESRLLLSAGSYGDVSLRDARTAEPLALPVQVEGKVYALEFNPRGNIFSTGTDKGELRLWFLPEERRGLEELKTLSQLLSGIYVHPTAGPTQIGEEEVERLWQQLRGTDPEVRP